GTYWADLPEEQQRNSGDFCLALRERVQKQYHGAWRCHHLNNSTDGAFLLCLYLE
ncbi:hypothetical protein BgiMline_035161, partial [Biomphalaria glabrata]